MGTCQTKRCNQEVKSGWNFCPNCGKDIRPFEFRPTIISCGHKFPTPKRYCVICGEGYGGAKTAAATEANIRFGKTLIFIGVVLAGITLGTKQVIGMGSGPGFWTFKNFYDSVIVLPGNISLHGSDIATYVLCIGAALIFFGFVGTTAAKLNRPKKRSSSSSKKAAKA